MRTPLEKEEFKWMLTNVNLIYLAASVLILQDLSYLARFCAPHRRRKHPVPRSEELDA